MCGAGAHVLRADDRRRGESGRGGGRLVRRASQPSAAIRSTSSRPRCGAVQTALSRPTDLPGASFVTTANSSEASSRRSRAQVELQDPHPLRPSRTQGTPTPSRPTPDTTDEIAGKSQRRPYPPVPQNDLKRPAERPAGVWIASSRFSSSAACASTRYTSRPSSSGSRDGYGSCSSSRRPPRDPHLWPLKQVGRSLYLLGKHKAAVDVYDEAQREYHGGLGDLAQQEAVTCPQAVRREHGCSIGQTCSATTPRTGRWARCSRSRSGTRRRSTSTSKPGVLAG